MNESIDPRSLFNRFCEFIGWVITIGIPVLTLFLGLGLPFLWRSLHIPLVLSLSLTIVEFLLFFWLVFESHKVLWSMAAANFIIMMIAGAKLSAQANFILFLILTASGLLGYTYKRWWTLYLKA